MDMMCAVRCTTCGAEELQPVEARSAFWQEERLVVVDGIPALRCLNCGEQFYDDAAVVVLDLLRGRGFDEAEASGTIRVPVFSFRDAAGGAEET